MTVTEVLVATALAGVFMLLLVCVHRLLQSTESGSVKTKSLDVFEIQRRLEMNLGADFERNVQASGDAHLSHCLEDLCATDCPKESVPLKWGVVPLYVQETPDGPVNLGGAFRLPDWTLCGPVSVDVVENGVVRHGFGLDPSCQGRAKASWRALESGLIEVRVELGVVGNGNAPIVRELVYPFPRAEKLGNWCPYGIPNCPNHIHGGYGDGKCSGQRVSCEESPVGRLIGSTSVATSFVECVDGETEP